MKRTPSVDTLSLRWQTRHQWSWGCPGNTACNHKHCWITHLWIYLYVHLFLLQTSKCENSKLILSIPVQMKKLFLVQDANLRALVTSHSLFRLPLSRTTCVLTSDTAVLPHSLKLLIKHLFLMLPTLSYYSLLTCIGCCTQFSFLLPTSSPAEWRLLGVGWAGAWGVWDHDWEREGIKGCRTISMCTHEWVWMQGRVMDRVKDALLK